MLQLPDKPIELKYLRHILPDVKKFLFTRGKVPELCLKMIPIFNDFVWGIPKKALTVIGARTSEGKSTFAGQIAYDLALQGKKILFLSLETTVEKIGVRLFCLHARFDNTKAFKGHVPEHMGVWEAFETEIKDLPLVITDMVGKNFEDIERAILDCKFSPDAVIVDYIQTIADRQGQNKLDTINEYIRHFREMAIRYDFSGIICSQINRTGAEDGHQPQLHHLQGSSFLEQHADLVLLLSWPFKYLKKSDKKVFTYEEFHKFTVYVAKNKDGQTGFRFLKFTPDYYLFEDWLDQEKIDKPKDHKWVD